MTRLPVQLTAWLGLLLAAACSSATPDSVAARQPGSPEALAAAAVAEHTGGKADEVVIQSVEAVDFGDSSLGCPQPGMAYLQVITPGYKVVAELAGSSFDVRVAGSRAFVCIPGKSQP